MTPVLHLRGPVLVGPQEVVGQAWVVGGRITFERPAGDATPVEGWVVPGLVDAHCHVGLDRHGAVDDATSEVQARTDRDAGALLLRDAGSPADTRWIDDRDDLPVVVRAGRHIARTKRYLRDFGEEVEPEQLVETVRRQAARGDGWVKLVGDWIDRDTGDLAPCWPLSALRPAIAAAHEAGARVTAHCFSEDSLPDLVEAGIDCIEHATGLDERTLPLLAARGVAVVPTLINIATFPDIAAAAQGKFPVYAAHMRSLHERRYATVAAASDAGLPVYAGTDAGGSLAHGRVVDEVLELARAGLPTADALAAACWSARDWLGRDGLTEGASADLLVLEGDPRSDLRVLQAPGAVVLRGTVRAGTVSRQAGERGHVELTAAQGRVLGALVEKERTTPQGYPLTDSALLAACNQTTSRDPVVSYDVATVRMAVRELRELGLLRTVHRSGERSDKHRHELEPALGLSPGQVALLAVLLLRGPQTLAELRSRTERMHPFASTDEVDAELGVMAERDEPLVALLPRQPGRKEARFTQLLVPAPAGPRGPASTPGLWASSADAPSTVAGRPEPAPAQVEDAGDAGLAAAVAELADEVAALRREVDELRTALERATGG